MRFTGRLLAAAAATIVLSSTAMAADVVVIPPPPAPPPPVPVEEPAFAGPYWGVFGGRLDLFVNRVPVWMAGTQFGYNFVAGNLRVGFEIETEHPYVPGSPTRIEAHASARAGFVINNAIMIYGQAGIGAAGIPVWSFGGGVEVALGNSGLTAFAEAKRLIPIGGGTPGFTIRGGLNYYADENNLDAAGNFDWGGLYFGANISRILVGQAPPFQYGVQVGYNFGTSFIVGAEVETTHASQAGAIISASLNGRVGVVLGSIFLYGEVGISSWLVNPTLSFGGGVEVALGDRLSLFAEAKRLRLLGGGPFGALVGGGINVHFGH